MTRIKIAVVGGSCVGKSAFVEQIVSKKFLDAYTPTIDECHNATLLVDDKEVDIEINDTAGSEEYEVIRNKRMNECNGFVLVYSITNFSSLNDLKQIIRQLHELKGNKKLPMILVGNKLDLVGQRLVPYVVGEILAMDLICPFVEISAMDREEVVSVFAYVVRRVEHAATQDEDAEVVDGTHKSKCCILL